MSSIEIGELLGTLSRDKQRAQQPVNQFYAAQQLSIIAEKALKPLEDYGSASTEELRTELRRITKQVKQKIEEIQNEEINVDELREINDLINKLLQAKYEVSQILNEPCPKLKYKYFGAYREYLLKTGKKQIVREVLDSSDESEDEVPISFERRRKKGKGTEGQEKAQSAYSELEVSQSVPKVQVNTLQSKIYAAFNLQNGCKTVYSDEPKHGLPPKELYTPLELSEADFAQIDAEMEAYFLAKQEAKRKEMESTNALLEERKKDLLARYS